MNKMININGMYVFPEDIRIISKVQNNCDKDGDELKGFIYQIKLLDLQGLARSAIFGSKKDAEKSRMELVKSVENSRILLKEVDRFTK